MVQYYGDFAEDATVYIPFNTFDSNDPSASVTVTNLADADIKVHKDGSVTQIVTDGATVATNFDSITGNHLITVDTSAHADYSTGSDYIVRLEGITVDGATLNVWVGSFSIENRFTNVTKWNGNATTFGTGGPDVNVNAVSDDTAAAATLELFVEAVDQATGQLDTGSFAAGAINAAALGADCITSAKIADGAFVAANFAASSLDGKGDWNVGKTGYSLTQTFPTNFADMAITVTTGQVTVGTNNDKTGYTASTVSDKTGYSLTATTGLGNQTADITGTITTATNLTTNNDKTGYALSAAGVDAIWDETLTAHTTPDSAAVAVKDVLADTSTTLQAELDAIQAAVITNAAGADIAADIIAVKAETASILTDTGTTLETHLTDIKGATFSGATDSLEAIRDRGDAAWTTGAGGSDRLLLVDTTIATLATQTSFTLTAGSADNDAYNNCTIVVEDVSTATQKAVGVVLDYVGATKTVTLKEALAFTIAATDKVYILAENALKSTVANRQLDVTATGAAGIDWGNIENPTTAVDLSGTDIQLADTVTTLTDHTPQTGDNYARLGAPAGASVSADVAAVKTETAAILVDTGTTLETHLTDIKGGTFSGATDSLEAIRDRGDAAWTTGAGAGLTPLASGTAQSGTASTVVLAAAAAFADNVLNGNVIKITSGTGAGQSRVIISNTLADDTCNIAPNWATNPSSDSVYEIVNGSVNIEAISLDNTAANNLELDYDGTGYDKANSTIGTTTTNTDMRGTDSAATATALATVDTVVDAVKVKTDQMVFTKANELDVNTQSINGATIVGDGNATPWDGA